MATSPSVDNYYIGKGNIYMKAVDASDGSYAHIGNCPSFKLTTSHEFLEHHVDSGGLVVLDEVQLKGRTVNVSISAEEFTPENLAVALGAVSVGGGVYRVSFNYVTRAVKFVGSNAKGQKATVILPKVLFTLEGDLELIGETYMAMPLSGRAMFYPKTPSGSDYTFADFSFS